MESLSLAEQNQKKNPLTDSPQLHSRFLTIIYTWAQNGGIKSSDPSKVTVWEINLLLCARWKFCQQRLSVTSPLPDYHMSENCKQASYFLLPEKLHHFECAVTFSQRAIIAWILSASGPRNAALEQVSPGEPGQKKSLQFAFDLRPHNLLLSSSSSLTPDAHLRSNTTGLWGEPRSITLPQRKTIRLIFARAAPNLAAWQPWVWSVTEVIRVSPAPYLAGGGAAAPLSVCQVDE